MCGRRRASTSTARELIGVPEAGAGKNRAPIVDPNIDPKERWLPPGYIDWIVGPRSTERPLYDLEQLSGGTWHRAEASAVGLAGDLRYAGACRPRSPGRMRRR